MTATMPSNLSRSPGDNHFCCRARKSNSHPWKLVMRTGRDVSIEKKYQASSQPINYQGALNGKSINPLPGQRAFLIFSTDARSSLRLTFNISSLKKLKRGQLYLETVWIYCGLFQRRFAMIKDKSNSRSRLENHSEKVGSKFSDIILFVRLRFWDDASKLHGCHDFDNFVSSSWSLKWKKTHLSQLRCH